MLLAWAASAAEPDMSGVWVYTAKDSYWSTNDLPANFSLTIDMKLSADQIVYSSVNDSDKNKIGRLSFVAPAGWHGHADRQSVPLQPGVGEVGAGPGELEIVQSLNGDVIVASFYTFRDDGKTMVRRGWESLPEGKSKAYHGDLRPQVRYMHSRYVSRATVAGALAPTLTITVATAMAAPPQVIDPEKITEHVRVLASDEFEGRAPASAGEKKTVEYLIAQLKAAGLQPGGDQQDRAARGRRMCRCYDRRSKGR